MSYLRTIEGGFNRYLGDGVYASFDGYNILLAVDDHENKVIAIEPEVWAAWVGYHADLCAAQQKAHEEGKTPP